MLNHFPNIRNVPGSVPSRKREKRMKILNKYFTVENLAKVLKYELL